MRKKVEEGQKEARKSKKRKHTAMCLIASFHYSIIIERLLDSGLVLTQGIKRQSTAELCLCGNYILAIDILNLQAMEWSSGRRWYQIKCLKSLEICSTGALIGHFPLFSQPFCLSDFCVDAWTLTQVLSVSWGRV